MPFRNPWNACSEVDPDSQRRVDVSDLRVQGRVKYRSNAPTSRQTTGCAARGRMRGMEPNPYESPQHSLERQGPPDPAKRVSPWVWIAYWIIMSLVAAEMVYAVYVLFYKMSG